MIHNLYMIPRTGNSHVFPVTVKVSFLATGRVIVMRAPRGWIFFNFYLAAMFFNYFFYDGQTQTSPFDFGVT